MGRYIEEWCSYKLSLEFFTQRNFVANFFRILLAKTTNRVLCHPKGDLGITYTIHLWLVRKCIVNKFRLVLIEHFSLALTVEVLWAAIGRNRGVWKVVGQFERKFQWEWGLPTNNVWRQKTRVHGPSRGVVCVILRLVVFVLCWLVADKRTDRHTMTANTRASIASRG